NRWGFARGARGRVTVALFAGPSGTGKTLAAKVLAADLGTDLYGVDLGSIASKWIGETEKNLGAVFDAVEAGGSVLLLDEADALFGKRTAVTASDDRLAHEAASWLLHRIESHRGLIVLETTRRHVLDPRLLRRVHLVVDFPPPGRAERRAMW